MKTEDNELIAVFYGKKVSMSYRGYTTMKDVCDLQEAKKHGWEPNLSFDTSWDSFMPVLKRAMDSIKESGWGTPTENEAKARLRAVQNEVCNVNLKAANFCLVQYIKFYNSLAPLPLSKE